MQNETGARHGAAYTKVQRACCLLLQCCSVVGFQLQSAPRKKTKLPFTKNQQVSLIYDTT